MNSSALGFDLMALLQNVFSGQFSPRREDGLAKLAVGGGGGNGFSRNGNPMYGPSIAGLGGADLVRAWARMDRNPQGDELAGRYPGSQYASWWNGLMGNSTGYQRASRASHALGGNLGGGLGQMSNQDYLKFMGGLL